MIWKLNNSDIYLSGTFHMLKDETNPYSKRIEEIYSKSTQLVLETDISKADLSITKYSGNTKLSDNIPSKLFKKTKSRWLKSGLSIEELEKTKPWQVATRILLDIVIKKGFSHEKGLDNQLLKKAKSDGKKIIYLEPPTTALQCFDSAPLYEQTKYLSKVVNNINTNVVKFNILLNAWITSDIEKLTEILEQHLKDYPNTYRQLILHRNEQWLNEINTILKTGVPTLIAIGALHCVAHEYCIQNMLKDNYGYNSTIL